MATHGNPVVSDQKKRTSEALKRRFALAETQLLQNQPVKNKKLSSQHQQWQQEEQQGQSKLSSPLPPPPFEPQTSSVSTTFPFPSSSKKQDVEADGPAYYQLSQPLHENLLTATGGIQLSSRRGRSVADKIVNELLQNGDSAQKYTQGSKSIKIGNWLLLDSLVHGRSASTDARSRAGLRSHSKRSKGHMSLRQHRKCGSFDLPVEFHNFDMFKPMHEMWKDYTSELLKDVGAHQLAQCLHTADLHGAILLVVECKTVALIGVTGIMIRETMETFGIITQDNRVRGTSSVNIGSNLFSS
ncbi:ribonuclease P family protein [Tasmannia lanceolata]|uniref:ribonuclease P family protein n=1 Tax=Tasmannia lanceolata TaxID=3420 RepID=UPI0040636E3E